MIRLHLEYTVQVWNTRLIGDIESLEKVQRRSTKILTKLSQMSYDQRLAQLDLTSLKDRHNLNYNRDSFKSRRRNDFAFFVAERHNFFLILLPLVGTFYRQI